MKKKKPTGPGMSKGPPDEQEKAPSEEIMLEERAEVIAWLRNVKFRRKLIGGVDERSVWKRIGELDALYTKLLEAERGRYNALLNEYKQSAARRIRALEEQQWRGGGPVG